MERLFERQREAATRPAGPPSPAAAPPAAAAAPAPARPAADPEDRKKIPMQRGEERRQQP
jgi:ribosomal protein L12E/L44/L45/RPP1/RPP2